MLKDSFLHLPVFLLLFVAAFSVLLFLSLLASWTMVYNPGFPLEAGWLENQIRSNAGNVLPASVFAAIFLLFFRMRRKPGIRVLAILLPLFAAFIVMLLGITVVYGPPGSPRPREYGTYISFIPKTIHQAENGLVYVDEIDGEREGAESVGLENVVRYSQSRFQHFADAALAVRGVEDGGSAVIVPSNTEEEPVTISPANPVYYPVFSPPAVIAAMADDVPALNNLLLEVRTSTPERFALYLLSVLLPAVGCICFMRITRWPLFGAFLTLAAYRGLFLLVRFLQSDIGVEVGNMMPEGILSEMFVPLAFLVLGVVLAAVSFAFPGERRG